MEEVRIGIEKFKIPKIKDKKNFLIGFLLFIILFGTLAFAYNGVKEESYKIGFNDATLIINQQLMNNIVQNGYLNFVIPIQTEQGNVTYQVRMIIGNSTRIG